MQSRRKGVLLQERRVSEPHPGLPMDWMVCLAPAPLPPLTCSRSDCVMTKPAARPAPSQRPMWLLPSASMTPVGLSNMACTIAAGTTGPLSRTATGLARVVIALTIPAVPTRSFWRGTRSGMADGTVHGGGRRCSAAHPTPTSASSTAKGPAAAVSQSCASRMSTTRTRMKIPTTTAPSGTLPCPGFPRKATRVMTSCGGES